MKNENCISPFTAERIQLNADIVFVFTVNRDNVPAASSQKNRRVKSYNRQSICVNFLPTTLLFSVPNSD